MRIYDDNPAIRFFEDRGMTQGMSKGMTQGRNQRDVEIAGNMLRDGDDHQKISRITGLSVERIMELQNELQAVA